MKRSFTVVVSAAIVAAFSASRVRAVGAAFETQCSERALTASQISRRPLREPRTASRTCPASGCARTGRRRRAASRPGGHRSRSSATSVWDSRKDCPIDHWRST